MLPRQLFMTRPGKEGEEREEGEERQEGEESQEREKGKKADKQQQKVCNIFTRSISMMTKMPSVLPDPVCFQCPCLTVELGV